MSLKETHDDLHTVPRRMLGPLTDIIAERERQEELKRAGKFPWSLADHVRWPTDDELRAGAQRGAFLRISPAEKLAVLAEEFGEASNEVCRSLAAPLRANALYAELVQVAACCLAWLEAIEDANP